MKSEEETLTVADKIRHYGIDILMDGQRFATVYGKDPRKTAELLVEIVKTHDALIKERDSLNNFKTYVHARLDDMSVPADPEPENNASHGCRIEGRINYLQAEIQTLKEERDRFSMNFIEWASGVVESNYKSGGTWCIGMNPSKFVTSIELLELYKESLTTISKKE